MSLRYLLCQEQVVKIYQTLFLFGTFNCSLIQHRVQVFIASPSIRLFYRSRGSHSFRVSSPILEASGGRPWKTCGGEGKRGDETKVRRERGRGVCRKREQKRDRWGERMGERGRGTACQPGPLGQLDCFLGGLGDLDEFFIN